MHRALSILALLAACSSPETVAPPTPAERPQETVRAVLTDLQQLERPQSPKNIERFVPSVAADERHALELAEMAERAAKAKGDTPDDRIVRRLIARRADTFRDSTLLCRRGYWDVDVARPEHPVNRLRTILHTPDLTLEERADALRSFPNYVHAVERDLAAGLEQGLVASRETTQGTLALLDDWLAIPSALAHPPELERAMQMWGFPALRQYRDMLRRQIVPAARDQAGLHSLPGGRRCYDAELSRHLGPAWSVERLRRTSKQRIETTRQRLEAFARDLLPEAPENPAAIPRALAAANPMKDRIGHARSWGRRNFYRGALLVGLDRSVPITIVEMEAQPGGRLVELDPAGQMTLYLRLDTADGTLLEPLLAAGGYPGAVAMHQSWADTFRSDWFVQVHQAAAWDGWQLRAVQIARDHDLYSSDAARTGAAWLELRAAALARADIGLHADGWTTGETAAFLESTAGFETDVARRAVTRIVAFPGREAGALAGAEDYAAVRDYSAVLRYGPIPIDLATNAER